LRELHGRHQPSPPVLESHLGPPAWQAVGTAIGHADALRLTEGDYNAARAVHETKLSHIRRSLRCQRLILQQSDERTHPELERRRSGAPGSEPHIVEGDGLEPGPAARVNVRPFTGGLDVVVSHEEMAGCLI